MQPRPSQYRALLTTGTLLGLAPALPGFQGGWLSPSRTLTIPAYPADWVAVTSGELNGDWTPDLVALDGGTPLFLSRPHLFSAAGPVHGSLTAVTAMTAYPLAVPAPVTGGQVEDLLLASDPSGLVATQYVEAIAGFSAPAPVFAGSPWSYLARLRTTAFTLGTTTTTVALGLSADLRTIVSVYHDGTAWVAGPTWTFGSNVLDFDAVQWDGAGDTDLAVLTAGAISVYGTAGTLMGFVRGNGQTVGALRTVSAGGAPARLAWLTRLPAGAALFVLGPAGYLEAPVMLQFPRQPGGTPYDLQIAGMAAGDYDTDGRADLCVMDTSWQRAALLLQQTTPNQLYSATLLGGDHLLLQLAPFGSPAQNVAEPVFVDVNDDAAADVVYPQESVDALQFFYGPNGTLPPTSEYVVPVLNTTYLADDPPSSDNSLNLAFVIDHQVLLNNAFTHLEVFVWEQPDPTLPLDSTATDWCRYDLDNCTGVYGGLNDCDSYQWTSVPIPAPGDVWPSSNHWQYYVEYRLIKVVNGLVQDHRAAVVDGFTLQTASGGVTEADLAYLQGLQVPGKPSFKFYAGTTPYCHGCTVGGPTYLGGYYSIVNPPYSGGTLHGLVMRASVTGSY